MRSDFNPSIPVGPINLPKSTPHNAEASKTGSSATVPDSTEAPIKISPETFVANALAIQKQQALSNTPNIVLNKLTSQILSNNGPVGLIADAEIATKKGTLDKVVVCGFGAIVLAVIGKGFEKSADVQSEKGTKNLVELTLKVFRESIKE